MSEVICDLCKEKSRRATSWFRHSEMEDAWIMSNPYISDNMMDRILCGPCYLEEGHRKPTYIERKLKWIKEVKDNGNL